MNSFLCCIRAVTAALLLAVVVTGTAMAATAPITIYTDNYAGDEAMSRVARDLIEQHYDARVRLKSVSVGVAFLGTAHNDNALFMAAWLPKTHAAYMKRVKDQVDILGTIYNGARIGWVVPSYVPKDQLNSIADLEKPAIQKKLHHKIQGISAGAGEMQASHQALKAYGLNHMRLITASGPAMTAALKRAIANHQWIVVTGWSPHWMWQRFDLRYLKDPKKALGSAEHVDTIANPSLKQNYPRVAAMFSRMHFKLDDVNAMLADANKTSYDAAAKRFIAQHPDLVKSWLGSHS
ncbi:glycine betaine ABC transporter substrate-binding protein [Salinisphaera sp. LB1]|uniref:glycine betaine ABC transporter substrate-binding protein n=1 Tax=Salinisphaera sp. LB1 TaxID=2183911 RepID=UPI000D705380|nr:glycine betaine ABC transporter substrate-binding protein [Salinisphaera sp. LB1]AWN15235.1 Glycine betaine ABC transport system, glycine betaine-binding protein OpuAC [Salinisphaera sp. LB1]